MIRGRFLFIGGLVAAPSILAPGAAMLLSTCSLPTLSRDANLPTTTWQLSVMFNDGIVGLATHRMRLTERIPREDDLALREVFNQQRHQYKENAKAGEALGLRSAAYRYAYERERPFFATYFLQVDVEELRGRGEIPADCR